MKKYSYLLIFTLIIFQFSFSQKLKFKEKININIATKAKDSFPVKFVGKKKKKLNKTNVTYNAKGDTISYQLEKKTDWESAIILDSLNAVNNGITDFKLLGEITPKDEMLLIDFYPFTDSKDSTANKFIEKNLFRIKLKPRTNLKFKYNRFHAGTFVAPFKVYLDSRADSNNNNNIEADVNINLFAGLLMGTKRYVKIPSDEGYRIYEYGWSLNAFFGVNKLEIGEKNTLDTSSFQGSVVTSSQGINCGWHYKSFSIFGLFGIDIPLNKRGSDWYFKGKPWLGFGAGFEVF